MLGDLFVPHVFDGFGVTLNWNAKMYNYVVSIFGFVNKFFTSHGSILLFHDDDFRMLERSSLIWRHMSSKYNQIFLLSTL